MRRRTRARAPAHRPVPAGRCCTHGAVDELRDGGLLLGERRGEPARRGLEVRLGLGQRRHGAREVGDGGRLHGAQVLFARQRGFEVAALRLERGLGGLELHGAPAVARPRLDLLLAKLLEVDDRAEVAPQPRRLGLDQVAQREALVHARRHQQLVQRAHKVQHGHRLVVQLGVPRQRAAAVAAVVVAAAARRAARPRRVQRILGNARALVNQLLVHVAHELGVGALGAAAAGERLVQAQPARRAQAHFAQARADFIGTAMASARGAREGWAAGAARGGSGARRGSAGDRQRQGRVPRHAPQQRKRKCLGLARGGQRRRTLASYRSPHLVHGAEEL